MQESTTNKSVRGLRKYAYPIVGRCGLCNMMFKWAYAVVYCHETGARMLAPKWTNLWRLGPILRRERDSRLYLNQFTNEGYIKGCLRLAIVVNPFSQKKKFSDFKEFFDPLLDYRDLIVRELAKIAHPNVLREAAANGAGDFIGVHIRRGDFSFGENWHSNAWYIAAIKKAQDFLGGKAIKVKVFSDAEPSDLAEILEAFENAECVTSQYALSDLLAMARSKAMVCTCNSTFSMWAVYLGQMPSVWGDRNHINGSKRRMYVSTDASPIIVPSF